LQAQNSLNAALFHENQLVIRRSQFSESSVPIVASIKMNSQLRLTIWDYIEHRRTIEVVAAIAGAGED